MVGELPLQRHLREDAEKRRVDRFKSKVDLAKLLKGEVDEK
jgi:hypothetical protein